MGTYRDKLQLEIGAKDSGATTILNSVKSSIVGIGAAYLGWKGVSTIIKSIVDAAAESEKTWNDVSASLKRHGYQTHEALKATQDFTNALQRQTGISDELAGTGIQLLLDYGNKLSDSYKYMKVAADLAAGGHMDMRAAIDLVGKASVGYTATLSRYGIILDESLPKEKKFEEAIKQINERFGGAAQAQLNTYSGQLELLNENFGDLKEQLGTALIPTLNTFINRMNDALYLMNNSESTIQKLSNSFRGFLSLFEGTAVGDAAALSQSVDAMIQGALIETKSGALAIEAEKERIQNTLSNWNIPSPVFFDPEDIQREFDEIEKIITTGWSNISQFKKAELDQWQADYQTHLGIISIADQQHFEASLIGLNEYDTERRRIEEEFANLEAQIRADKLLSEQQLNQALIDLNANKAARLSAVDKRAADDVNRYWNNHLNNLKSNFRATIQDLVRQTDSGTIDIAGAFNKLGQSIRAMLVDVIIDAMFDYIKSIFTTTTAIAVETAAVKVQTAAYISLASAKVAATLGIGAGPAIAGATAVKASLTPMLLTGFDDPLNDRLGFKHGADYSRYFMLGVQSGLSAPGFGQQINQALPINQMPSPNNDKIYVYVIPQSMDESVIREKVAPAVQREAEAGRVNIKIVRDDPTGTRERRYSSSL